MKNTIVQYKGRGNSLDNESAQFQYIIQILQFYKYTWETLSFILSQIYNRQHLRVANWVHHSNARVVLPKLGRRALTWTANQNSTTKLHAFIHPVDELLHAPSTRTYDCQVSTSPHSPPESPTSGQALSCTLPPETLTELLFTSTRWVPSPKASPVFPTEWWESAFMWPITHAFTLHQNSCCSPCSTAQEQVHKPTPCYGLLHLHTSPCYDRMMFVRMMPSTLQHTLCLNGRLGKSSYPTDSSTMCTDALTSFPIHFVFVGQPTIHRLNFQYHELGPWVM